MKQGTRYMLFFSPEPGHTLPARELGIRLRRQGATVIVATTPEIVPLLWGSGLTCVDLTGEPLPTAAHKPANLATLESAPTGQSFLYKVWPRPGRERGQRIVQMIQKLLDRWQVDVLLIDALFRPRYHSLLKEITKNIPMIYVSTSLPSWGLEMDDLQSPILTLCPVEFEIPSKRRRPDELYYSFPCVSPLLRGVEHSIKGLAEAENSGSLIVVSFGTQTRSHPNAVRRLETVFAWARREPSLTFVVAAGPLAGLQGFPSNVLLQQTIAQHELLRYASLLVTHGGLGSLKEAILAGVPVLTLPVWADQPYNAMRVESCGIGRALFMEELRHDTIASTARKIRYTDSYYLQAKRLQEICLQYEQREDALSWLEGIATKTMS